MFLGIADKIEAMIGGGAAGGEEEGGEEDAEYGKPKIIARGINFPVLVHECFKGFLDFIAINGISKNSVGEYDEELWNKVKEQEDIVNYESWDIRLGPEIWRRIRSIHDVRFNSFRHHDGRRLLYASQSKC